ncbi:hypothetical protein K432DRAFT_385716 [Lepidopterella palustris CBS 459.81]|uniref:N-acetylglucosamine-induced protein 1 n=1 Tax=Lepidopterella palustris CBS 459.81 TaxID=1314670 RepID=A0A8E2E2G2_9PEZI|nr:hypothetical protein K432DRAFT_385716 [Lepidopterella palustris CBS 459.81]
MPGEALPFWLVNVPRDQWPAECPDFLRDVGGKDREIIGTPDSDYHRLSWQKVKETIRKNRIDLFHRVPSELRRYRQYTFELEKEYGSILNFIVNERLQWQNMKPKGRPFQYPEDLKILFNDWPYGVDEKIVHLVVWTKFDIEEDAVTGDLTPEGRKEINDYVNKIFCSRVNPDHVMWFKNWRSLKSVHAVEHFHVMLYNPDMDFINEITNGDVPLSSKVA